MAAVKFNMASDVVKPKIPSFYETKSWKNSICKASLSQRLSARMDEVKRRLPDMTLAEKRELWANEPYYEVSKLIVESKGWEFAKPNKK